MSIIEIFNKGGPVVWILFSYSVLALTIALERYIHFIRMRRLSSQFKFQLHDAIDNKELSQLLTGMRGPEAAVIRGIYQAYTENVKDLVRVATRLGSQELQRMERGFRTLGLLGDTAPLLGLFGTITGMIKAFMVIDEAGGKVDAQALAGGIWEAMVTTGVGLAVAIPILFILHWLENLAARRTHAMHQYASIMIEKLPHQDDCIGMEEVHHHKETTGGI